VTGRKALRKLYLQWNLRGSLSENKSSFWSGFLLESIPGMGGFEFPHWVASFI